jgi:hypothetical protein
MSLFSVSEQLFRRKTWDKQPRQSLFPCFSQRIKVSVASVALKFTLDIISDNFVVNYFISILERLADRYVCKLLIVITTHECIVKNSRIFFVENLI